jgi:hypothetical protein
MMGILNLSVLSHTGDRPALLSSSSTDEFACIGAHCIPWLDQDGITWPPALLLAAGAGKLTVQASKGGCRTVMGAQPKDQTPAMLYQSCRPVDQLLHHRLDAPALG